MKHRLAIEAIGDGYNRRPIRDREIAAPPAWVAQLVIGQDGLPKREFLQPKRDYAKANSIGSRGLMLEFLLDEGIVYEVSAPITWKRVRHYFTLHDGKGFLELERIEAIQFAKGAPSRVL